MKIAFIPKVEVDPVNSERTPKLLYLLSQWFEVLPVATGALDKKVFDQSGNRFSRYIMFVLNEMAIAWSTLRQGKKEGVSAVFAEGTYYSLAGGLAARILDVPMIWDNHGNIKDFSATLGKSRFFLRGNLLLERFLVRLASKVLVVSGREVEAYRALGFDTSKFEVLPTCADMALVDSRMHSRKDARKALGVDDDVKLVLFFGTLKYMPNLDAAQYIAREMYPQVAAEVAGVEVFIAGSGKLGEDAPAGVRMLGFVPDLYLWLSAADVCIAPMWKGVGILTKVIDMLSAGRATVVSPLALEGIPELEHGTNCLVGKDHQDFARQVIALLEDPPRAERLGREGRELVASSYSWEVVAPRLRSLVTSLSKDRQVHN
ncbi:MAG: glycosyltransferase family 4 protein [Methanomassiliicoccus sp.]|nr:glycosyltransferase family 4 protein [Methanomassiliicoccus sp.]